MIQNSSNWHIDSIKLLAFKLFTLNQRGKTGEANKSSNCVLNVALIISNFIIYLKFTMNEFYFAYGLILMKELVLKPFVHTTFLVLQLNGSFI